jgi:hypothetical protein
MKLRIRDIVRDGPIDLEEAIPSAHLPLETPDRPELMGPVQARMRAEMQDGVPWAWVVARARISIACARCLERYVLEVEPAFDVEATTEQEYLDVDDDVRQQLLLSLPPQPLCRPGCKGLCSGCGKNLNTGPCGCPTREPGPAFQALKNLKLN